MVARRTVDLLPEIFRTDTNKKFLSATLDQLTQEPRVSRTRGFVGRRIGPGVDPQDNYVREPNAVRTNYQLEPGVVFLKPDTNRSDDAITYPGMIDALDVSGAITSRQDRLFESPYYTWDSFCDLDKFTNYSQYYWLPGGPESVDVGTSTVPFTDDFDVTRTSQSYSFSGVGSNNPTITLVRGGNYQFTVDQPGNRFWIQSAPGVNGRLPATPNISSRDVLGVSNNGQDNGVVTFDVPLIDAQNFYYTLVDIGGVDLITELRFDEINNIYVDEFLAAHPDGIDGITNLNARTIVFRNPIVDAELGGWQIKTPFDPLPRNDAFNEEYTSFDTMPFSETTDILSQGQRYGIWQINYVEITPGRPVMQLNLLQQVPSLNKFQIRFGAVYSNTNWYKTTAGYFERIPLLTAVQDTLWYQDSTNPNIYGQIRLINQNVQQTLDVEEIVGAQNYTSPNGVKFTNGLKVQFRGLVNPGQFQNVEFYVEGVGTGPGLTERVGFVDGEAYYGPFHVYQGQRMTGPSYTGEFQQYIYNNLADSLANLGAGGPESAPLPLTGRPNATEGNGIRLVSVEELVTPETYTGGILTPYDSDPFSSSPFDETISAPLVKDYLTINRSSQDRNAWSRSNRWFHVDVIRYSAELNNFTPVIDNNARGKRPIVEFRAGIRLFNFGTQGKLPVNIIDFNVTDALSNVNGTTGYGVDGYTFLENTLVIFAADLDRNVRNRVYRVTFIDPDGEEATAPVINLVPEPDGLALTDQTVVALNGSTQQGKSFWFDGVNWILSQQKTGVNQAPLFDVYDAQGYSFGDRRFYPSTTFAGSRLFGYALGGTQITDVELGFALKYLNLNNVGDIVFTNYFYTDNFLYVQDRVGTEVPISTGFVRQYIDRVSFSELIGWLPAITQNRSRQIFRFINNTGELILDVPVDLDSVLPPVQIYINGVFLEPSQYQVVVQDNNTFITLAATPPADAVIETRVLSNQASAVGYYEVPSNLENNPLNQNSPEFTLGTIRTHYETIGQNLEDISGPIVGANNSRDLGNISRYGQNIIQNSSPLTLAGVFLREPQFEITQAIRFNSQEYEKYKARLIDLAGQGDFVNSTPTEILDACMQEISLAREDIGPFYWSDMIPAGETYTETSTVYSLISTPTFDLNRVYDFTQSNFQSILIYVNGVILTRGRDYTVGDGTPTVTITSTLNVGDVVIIREYATTFGSYVPNTPTKMGLYSAFVPELYLDTSYVTPKMVIRGHDGSITIAYGGDRDQILLEFETRIYNNLKIPGPVPMVPADVVPGQWRTTDYTLAEVNQILSTDFLSWIGWNKLDYTSQNYISSNDFTYNYSQSANKLDGEPLLGAWRGIYQYLYDTIAPNTRPWEMLGFSQEPTWWQDQYGPAPYTSGNLVLWQDLADGIVRDPTGEYIIPKYRRPQLLSAIPSGSEGELLSPLDVVVGNTNVNSYQRSWAFGDDGPTESAWRTSSSYPFAVMRLLALTKPAEFFSLFVDRDRYRFDDNIEQYLWNERYRLDARNLAPIYGNGTSRASYINWIVDYNRQLGVNSTTKLETRLNNLDVRLCWRLAAFSDKRFLKLFTERSTPTSTNASLLLPDESYSLMLYENPAFASFQYSSVVVQRVEDGWAVFGYSTTQPYFDILVSKPFGITESIAVANLRVNVPVQHSDLVTQVPYGYVFRGRAAVCDFLISYGKFLERQGMIFEGLENGYVMNWMQMAQEFLYWTSQGWIEGSMINLNPAATKISITRPNAVAQSLAPSRLDNIVLNQNRLAIKPDNLIINRLGNTIALETTGNGNDTINYFSMRFTAYEHMVILDNRSIFADLIYDPITGSRQSRILASGTLTADWNGTLNAPGFILNQDNIQDWQSNQVYTKGQIVRFKDALWTSSTIIQPSEEFNYTLWLRSDYDEIQQGLLPNAATVSDQLANSYSIYNANLEREIDLFSYGLIGFRPRQYMADLDLDDVSQVNLYQQFLGTKGTRGAVELFSLADLGKETAEYSIYEYWGIRRGYYGSTANTRFFEVLLDPPLLTSDPNIIEIIEPGQQSQADQTVLIENLWSTSYPFSTANILPTVSGQINDRALPSAGYVNFDDADYAVYEIGDLSTEDVNNLTIGSTIWAASDGAYDWNIYRAEKTPGTITSVSDNLDARSIATFDQAHGLDVQDTVIIRFFDADVDGAYQVLAVPSIYSIIIGYVFTGTQTTINGTGLALRLQTSRVQQASDIVDLPYSRQINPGSLVWVDRLPQGTWSVLEKTDPFTQDSNLTPEPTAANSEFGTSVSQGFSNLSALVGSPDYNPNLLADAPGAVYTFVRNFQDEYEYDVTLTATPTGIVGYGNDLDIGDQEWAIAGASLSNNSQGYALTIYRGQDSSAFEQRQLLNAGDLEFGATEFGYSVTISQDERWIGIGAPGDESSQVGGAVYIFGREDVQNQSVLYTTDGNTVTYNWSDSIKLTDFTPPAWQMTVILNNQLLTPGVDYIVDTSDVTLVVQPIADLPLLISRRVSVQLDQETYRDVVPTSSTGFGSEATFLINRVRGDYQVQIETSGIDYAPGDQLTIAAAAIGGGTSPTNDLVITVTVVVDGGIVDFTQAGSGVDNTPDFNLALYFAQVNSIWDFTVNVDGVLQRPEQDYDYTTDGRIFFVTLPAPGAIINVDAPTHFTYVDKITVAGLAASSRFGNSVTTTSDGQIWIVGAPGVDNGTGQSYVYSRNIQRFQVQTAGAQTFTTEQSLIGPTLVKVNGQFLIDSDLNFGGEFTVTSSNTVLVSRAVQVGDIVEISTNQFVSQQIIESQQAAEQSQFGSEVDQCINNCSLYVSAPLASQIQPQAGAVELWQNQVRLYGTITSTIANPIFTPGDTIYVNGFLVTLTGTDVASLALNIRNAAIPNATAVTTSDLEFVSDGLTTVYNVGAIYSDSEFTGSPTTVVKVNGVLQTPNVNYTYNNTLQTITFATAPDEDAAILVISGRIVISARDISVAPIFNKLTLAAGVGDVLDPAGLYVYIGQQIITSPVPQDFARFGASIFISDNTTTLAVGAPNGSTITYTTFDNNTTVFDATGTQFEDPIVQSGAIYLYDFLPAYEPSATNPGQFVFGQQVTPTGLQSMDRLGRAVDLTTGTLLIGAPGADLDNGQSNYGTVFQFVNLAQSPSWQIKRLETPQVDVNLLDTLYIYNYLAGSAATYLDYFNPLQGRLLGAVAQNLDYVGAIDPASYNVGPVNNRGNRWGQNFVGRIWWDTTRVRFVDAQQGDLDYASRRWGQVFPGSEVQIYQWTASDVPPADYQDSGTPRDIVSYVVVPTINQQGIFSDVYYFWVSGVDQVATALGKTLSTVTMSRYIEDPRSSGIPYLAPLASNAIALYNCQDAISQLNSVLHVEFDQTANDNVIHSEFQLIAQGRPDAFLDAALYRKLLDSFCGVDTLGAQVPNPFLGVSERYGIAIRPRQSMFVNRFAALQNYLTSANLVLAQFPISETKSFRLLNSRDPEPNANSPVPTEQWNFRVANDQELSFQDLATVPLGYRYLVASDATNQGFWAIYEVIAGVLFGSRTLRLIRVQNYDTRRYWSYIDWFLPGYDPLARVLLEVPQYSSLLALNVPTGSSAKVTANAQGKWEIYLYNGATWDRVGLESGTIEFSRSLWDYTAGNFGYDVEVFDAQYFDQEPVIETRKILEAINQELLTDELLIERNRLLILMFNYILSEQISPDWLTKTSLIDVDHTIRNLQPFQVYRKDNQDFVLDYINEVKPYHTQIREFGLIYRGLDTYLGNITDFDLPAQWNEQQQLFISPVLDNTGLVSSTSSTPSNSPVWQEFPYNQWFQNYLLSIESVIIADPGSGYTVPPQVTVTGTAQQQAVMIARINSAGQLIGVDVLDPGAGYQTLAEITLTGGNGSGARAVAVMGNPLVRSITTTIKYDRYQYGSDITPWQSGQVYLEGDRVRYINRVWQATIDDSGGFSSTSFDPDQWTEIPASALSGADRTVGYYTPTADQPGVELAQLISGISYPGVQVSAPGFNQNTGFDVGNFDINPFDNIAFGPEGLPTYDPAILDAIYESTFTDPFLGVLPAPAYAGNPPTTGPNPIIVDGGAFVDTYSSHAPPELIPGAMFDTLDLRVYSTPGANWPLQGRGFPLASRRYDYYTGATLSYAGVLNLAVDITVFNCTTGRVLTSTLDYQVDWIEQTVTIASGASNGDTLQITANGMGGGNQIFAQSYIGSSLGNTLVIPRPFSSISQIVIFLNGDQISNFSYNYVGPNTTLIEFTQPYLATDLVTITVFGNTAPVVGWSTPVTQYIVSDGGLSYTLGNNLGGINPVNLVVAVDGERARPYNGIVYSGNGSTVTYDLPTTSDISPALIAENDVAIFINNTELTLGVDFVVDPYDFSTNTRSATLFVAPPVGTRVLISVRTGAQYRVVGSTLQLLSAAGLNPPAGSIIAVTSYNDTQQQTILTTVYVGPSTIDGTNRFPVGQTPSSAERLVVSLDGEFLFEHLDYQLNGVEVEIPGAPIAANAVMAITSFDMSQVAQAEAFRIFQDMRGLQRLYRITEQSSTVLTQSLSSTGDVIYVADAANLDQPSLAIGVFGVITINGERITYRVRNLANNTLSGLRRGTAGTGAASHDSGATVLSLGNSNLLPAEYQRRTIFENLLADGVETDFTAETISLPGLDSTELVEAVQVYVGGILQLTGYTIAATDPVRVEFDTAPTAGYQVSIRIQQGQVLYQQGAGTASNGVPLQETNTPAAIFIRD